MQSFTGKFKKISLDDEPDELMLKYGDIKLKGPGGGEGQSGIHAARTSFFFQKPGRAIPKDWRPAGNWHDPGDQRNFRRNQAGKRPELPAE